MGLKKVNFLFELSIFSQAKMYRIFNNIILLHPPFSAKMR